jgi:hypothetical protein
MRALAASIAVHALGLWLVLPGHPAPPRVAFEPPARIEDSTTAVEILEPPAAPTAGGHASGEGGHASARAEHAGMRAGHATRIDPWGGLALGMDSETRRGNGNEAGTGLGNGNGNGSGIGFGDGGAIAERAAVPAPPVPPPPSKARPAKLLHPSRDLEVEDADYLFVARITVDEDGDVVAVRMTTTHPGVRADQASSAIWSFRYAPALDDGGMPIRSTFEQPFQVR